MSKPSSAKRSNSLKNKSKFFSRKTGFIAAFLSPGVLLFLIIYAYPLITVFATSFSKWNYQNFSSPEFLGFANLFDNYKQLFTKDYYFWTAFKNSLKWAGLSLIIQVPLSVLVALVLARKPLGWKITRNAFIIPNIISTAAIGLIFLNMYNPDYGIVTAVLQKILPGRDINILSNATTAFWGVTFSFVLFAGSSMILVLAQIFSISPDLIEAAEMDGAKRYQIDLKIILPLLKPMIGTVAVLATNYSLLLYNEIALITAGRPDGQTFSLSYFIFQKALGSTKLNFALGNTAGVVQFMLGIVLIGVINKVFSTNKSEI